ncbi:TPA: 50S ribosomal protein L13 [Candidatus Dependentiae bacterium]|nr:50S ribosomal protein L13 [Candidatus Dependentiae bacterium]HBZ73442.1 50S ribosomal protein L13 [Candidatus Dependentiae bacterium]
MNKSFIVKKENRDPQWRVIDASGRVLGRLATEIADILRGKDKPEYTPHVDCGDYVIVTNCEKIVLTGNKWDGKIYSHYTGYRSGLKEFTAEAFMKKDPTKLIELAVKRMLPKNKLNRQIFSKLKVYAGKEHPHEGQVSVPAK